MVSSSEDEKLRVQKWPCYVSTASLKISRKHPKQTKKASARHINHSSAALTSPDIVKLGGRKSAENVLCCKQEGKSHALVVQGRIGVPEVQWPSGAPGQEVAAHVKLLWVLNGVLSSSGFSYGWFNTALMLECRSYLPWLTNR